MMPRSQRKGSALLIVLGMLSFMIVSAVGFAAYMRYARLPSSYLRRTASSRQLVKAALAEAIEALDRAVNNNPHPGVGDKSVSGMKNRWEGRVLIGADGADEDLEGLAGSSVSPLTLEALAYLPPPLVNSVRYHSRRTPTAQWKSFDFDAGRYAYCVVDVSDYFDINRLLADSPRSSAPNGRVSLSYLFEEGRDHRSAGEGAQEWDDFLKKYRGVDEETREFDFSSKYPLISMADFNLALGANGAVGGITSPFYDYVSGREDPFITLDTLELRDKMRRMTFVTDSLFPQKEKGETEVFDLNDAQYQPIAMDRLKSETPLTEALSVNLFNHKEKWLRILSGVGCCSFVDYLDEDSVPISLAIPTVERVPMICGIRALLPGSKFSLIKEPNAPKEGDVNVIAGAEDSRRVKYEVSYRIKSEDFLRGYQGGEIQALAAFPFLRGADDSKRSFSVDGQFSMFFTTEHLNLRNPDVKNGSFSLAKDMPGADLSSETGFLNVGLQPGKVSVKDDIFEARDAVMKVDGMKLSKGTGLGPLVSKSGNELLRITYEWTQTKPKNTLNKPGAATAPPWTPTLAEILQDPHKVGADGKITATSGFKFLNPKTGEYISITDMGEQIKSSGNDAGYKGIRLNAALWLRIKEGDKVVDMVPASLSDDATQNSKNDVKNLPQEFFNKFGNKNPILPFETGVEFDLTINGLNGLADNPALAKEVKLSPETILVSDPRYNYAPEAWFKNDGEFSEDAWLQNNGLSGGGENGKARDIFMATSDAGYLQSIYELAFLPRVTKIVSYTDQMIGDPSSPDGVNRNGIAASFGETWCKSFAWTTFDPINADREAFEDTLSQWTSEGTGFKVNPYSNQTNILMAAYANTPLDWRRAATNVSEEASTDHTTLKAKEFNSEFAYNEYSSGGKFAWADLEAIAGAHMESVRSDTGSSWLENWNKMWRDNAGDDENTLCGIELEKDEKTKVWDVDKKYLYGFWRESFAAKQQLFMVFVRAEPMMMGSGSSKQLPPQLGGRAMALVWRDPTETKEDSSPHKTRVLFYKQFE